ncbi:uncharacterized protein F4822DRAFT_256770 [Hypoxylon trugodes]|uniref:uncharacterized protein n=1 Tax=Hypoxylon trugodes TaxID=326681 RepID=UPI00219AA6BB|nr:uncharacterized protein F4822DRAFT_256770 [Hypoxylon trugodes]KAI1388764.1 hypothetical protein F4822DRAFT_256770 [Hypoxylon trugodes]
MDKIGGAGSLADFVLTPLSWAPSGNLFYYFVPFLIVSFPPFYSIESMGRRNGRAEKWFSLITLSLLPLYFVFILLFRSFHILMYTFSPSPTTIISVVVYHPRLLAGNGGAGNGNRNVWKRSGYRGERVGFWGTAAGSLAVRGFFLMYDISRWEACVYFYFFYFDFVLSCSVLGVLLHFMAFILGTHVGGFRRAVGHTMIDRGLDVDGPTGY